MIVLIKMLHETKNFSSLHYKAKPLLILEVTNLNNKIIPYYFDTIPTESNEKILGTIFYKYFSLMDWKGDNE